MTMRAGCWAPAWGRRMADGDGVAWAGVVPGQATSSSWVVKGRIAVNKQPTMEDVARECGVSRALVSIVFRGAPGASRATRERVLATAERMGYRHNMIAARLASRTTRTLGVFIFDIRNGLTADVFDGIQEAADARGIGLVTGVSDPTGRRDARTMEELHAARVDAVLLISAAMSGDRIVDMSGAVPTISITRRIEGLDSVIGDDVLGARLLTEHLVDRGHRRIAMLGPTWSPSDRVAGFEQAMAEAGLCGEVISTGSELEAVREAMSSLLDRPENRRPTAIMAHNDLGAYSVLDVAAEMGVRVPTDLAVTGYDDLRSSASPRADLTTVNQHARELGARGVSVALKRLDKPALRAQVITLSPELVLRGSTDASPC